MEYQQQVVGAQQTQNNQFMQYQGQDGFYNTNRTKSRGLNLYQIPIFEIYNPKNATVVFQVDTKTNELSIMMAPAIPDNPAINSRGPVPKGTLVYDYSKKLVSNFSDVEIIDFIHFLRDKFDTHTNNRYESILADTNQKVSDIRNYLMQVGQAIDKVTLDNFSNQLNMLVQQNMQVLSNGGVNNKENQFGMYRKKYGMEDRAWNFVYDPAYNMLHINVMSGALKIKTSLSVKMALRLLRALESYVSNYACMNVISEIAHSLSKTLAFNNILAPSKTDAEMLD